ncbi:hypothetical protein, partial [Glaesserella parasuis]|uniref:hypothetical protein n=1 Tax=Glaesserella parasuis TaxID=738 RepID=UPI0038547793
MKRMLEKLCLWYLKKYWNSKAYKAEQAKQQAKQTEKQPHFLTVDTIRHNKFYFINVSKLNAVCFCKTACAIVTNL